MTLLISGQRTQDSIGVEATSLPGPPVAEPSGVSQGVFLSSFCVPLRLPESQDVRARKESKNHFWPPFHR